MAEHSAYNRLAFAEVKAEGVRFINKNAEDLRRHIYKIRVRQQWKDAYNFRAVRWGEKLYIFVDGRQLEVPDVHYPASRIGFCQDKGMSECNGIMYYHTVVY